MDAGAGVKKQVSNNKGCFFVVVPGETYFLDVAVTDIKGQTVQATGVQGTVSKILILIIGI